MAPAPVLPAPALDVDALIDDPAIRIVVCCGSGGVGKTTTAAAVGLRAAERGRRVVVLTIDPAKRLAQSMGLGELDNTPRTVPGVDVSAGGGLQAMMLDMKRTFDEVVLTHADPERARTILENSFYQSLSSGFAGTQEYMAMEKLGQLSACGEWDLIVVDTPPSRSALDFLDAPQRLGSFLDGRFVRLLGAPARVGGRGARKVLSAGMGVVSGVLGRVLGGHVLSDLSTLVAALDTVFGGFRERAEATYRRLQGEGTAFLVVATPERDALREAAYFVERLAADRMPLAGLVLNRVHVSRAERLTRQRALAAAEALESAVVTTAADVSADVSPDGPDAPGTADDGTDGTARSASFPYRTAGVKDPQPGHTPVRVERPTAHGPVAAAPSSPQHPWTAAAPLTATLLRLHAEQMQVIARERRARNAFTAVHRDVAVAEVPALPEDVHDLDGLRRVGSLLAAGAAPAERGDRTAGARRATGLG
ncbi:ArsA family ATPase [Allostreptomyces psammosilenae]|uniref:ArsA family ATPase n=1 Tax=Allostreptomyces psammosilenae TaxID=1892865 RepID=UPI0015CADA95|nr:ArsA family ATPase [Allostreptomyces psammosilenae]